MYFNQSFTGPCQGGSLFRQSQMEEDFCGAPQVAAARAVNHRIHSLARVLNTQSYAHSFGAGLDTMLKADNGSAYIFAMVDGTSSPGERTFTLPAGLVGTSVEVIGEDRTLPVAADGTFSDTFEHEYSYHIYRLAI